MKNVIKGSLISVATCAVLLSLQGCGSDRAGISTTEARALGYLSIPGNGRNIDPEDYDNDGIKDAIEKQPYVNDCGETVTSDWKMFDSDGDGLKDGYERKAYATYSGDSTGGKKCTNPQDNDSDNDGIKDGDEVLGYYTLFNSTTKTDPTDNDSDNDGLIDGDEKDGVSIGGVIRKTDPNNPDTDGDMLSDGVEAESAIQTNPLDIDSDHDGVTDGIEVCGTKGTDNTHTNGYGSGQIDAIDVIGLNIGISNDGTSSLNDKLNTLVNHYGGNRDCSTPANTNNDLAGKIDAWDPTNDSDGDERPNNKEKSQYKDPLDFGNKYSWITETPQGQTMINKGYVYIPATDSTNGNSKGYWMAKIEARSKVVNQSVEFMSVSNGNVNNVDRTQANTLIIDSDSQPGTSYSIKLPTVSQYQQLFKVKTNSTIANDGNYTNCLTVYNKYRDANIPLSYQDKVCELKNDFEVTNGGNWYNKNGSNTYNVRPSSTDKSFRGASSGIAELSYPMN